MRFALSACISASAFFAVSLLFASPAIAQIFNPAMMSEGGGSSYRSTGLSIPAVTATREHAARLEFNLSGQGALGIEGTLKRKREEVSEKEQAETGESLIAEAQGAGLMISRYSSGMDMSGFYWTMAFGYREEKMSWTVAAEQNDPQANIMLLNDKNRFEHEAVAKGTTGSLRIGYRYVGSSLPVIAGVYLGARHFQASVEDAEQKDQDQGTVAADPMTDRERERLRRRVTSAPDAGLEIGFAF
jgi:hypothetical protein